MKSGNLVVAECSLGLNLIGAALNASFGSIGFTTLNIFGALISGLVIILLSWNK